MKNLLLIILTSFTMITCKKSVLPSQSFGCEIGNSDSCVAVQNGDTSKVQFVLSPVNFTNLITNGTFNTGTGWVIDGSWVISGGVATALTGGSLLRPVDFEITTGYYMVQLDVFSTFGAGDVDIYLGGHVIGTITGGNLEMQTVKIFRYMSQTPTDNDLEFLIGGGDWTIDNVIVYKMSELEADINVCETGETIYSIDPDTLGVFPYLDFVEYFMNATVSLDKTGELNESINFTGYAQLELDWEVLALDTDVCYCICYKDFGLLGYNLIRNGIFDTTSFWAISNSGAVGWAITGNEAVHTSELIGTADTLSQTLLSATDPTKNYKLSFDVTDIGSYSFTIKADTAEFGSGYTIDTIIGSGDGTAELTFTGLTITKLIFSVIAANDSTIDNIHLNLDHDLAECVCQTICISYKESHDNTFDDMCNILITGRNLKSALNYDFEYFLFENSIRVFGKLRAPSFDYPDEEYYKHSDGTRQLVSTEYDEIQNLEIFQVNEAIHNILSVVLIHQDITLTIGGVSKQYTKRPGPLTPTWNLKTDDAPIVVQLIPKNQDIYNYLGS